MNKMSLDALAREHLEQAARQASGRSSTTLVGGHEKALRQTIVALRGGSELGDHDNSGEATLQVLRGRVTLTSGDVHWDGRSGDLLVVPSTRHSLQAHEDSVVLLTVAKI